MDAFKGAILRLLAQHAYSSRQVLQRLREENYTGGYSILKEYIRQVRPPTRPVFLTLHFDPGECAQLDWGCAGSLCVGNTRRRLSFLVMALCYSRQLYVEFALAETLEHFLAAQQNAFVYNVRIHGQTRQKPVELWILEKPKLLPLAPGVYDVGLVRSVHATNRCRVVFDTNRYSVPHEYASCRLSLRAYPDRVVLYHQDADYLRRLLEGECHRRRDARIQRRIQAARFPVIKTLETFHWNWPKKINRSVVIEASSYRMKDQIDP